MANHIKGAINVVWKGGLAGSGAWVTAKSDKIVGIYLQKTQNHHGLKREIQTELLVIDPKDH